MAETLEIVHALYCDFFERGVRYFYPEATLAIIGRTAEPDPSLISHSLTDGSLDLEWMGMRYHIEQRERSFTEDQLRLLGAIGNVLSARFRSIFFAASVPSTPSLFAGLQEDRFVSAFLDHLPYLGNNVPAKRDVIADAIQVLRESSLITYENRRIATGVILIGAAEDPYHEIPFLPPGALPYTSSLVTIKSFHRLCDGLHTVFLVHPDGLMVDLVDVESFSKAFCTAKLPAPSAARYRAHSLATLYGGHICLVLTPNGEIKVFAGGVQVFHFLEGRWHLSDITEKYHEFHQAAGDPLLAERLFTAALNLAENRRGGLFVLLDRAESARDLVAPADLLACPAPENSTKARVHYLLHRKRVEDLELNVLQSIARVDGGIVLDREGRLLAFGAILRHSGEPLAAQEGGRTTAAVHASRFGLALKISEDGMVSFYKSGAKVWEI